MKATKRKEFFAELKVLCKVHHTNLVELIGYSVSDDELFLVYEFAENRAVSDRLHDPLSKGFLRKLISKAYSHVELHSTEVASCEVTVVCEAPCFEKDIQIIESLSLRGNLASLFADIDLFGDPI